MKRLAIGLSCCLGFIVAMPVSGDMFSYTFDLDGLQEVPPNASPGFGSCTVDLDDMALLVDVSCSYDSLIGTTTLAHVHGAAPFGAPAGVLFPLPITVGVTSGVIVAPGIAISAIDAGHIKDGLAYVNIHTTIHPGGEIRGQIVPEPASLALLGLGGLALLRRRR